MALSSLIAALAAWSPSAGASSADLRFEVPEGCGSRAEFLEGVAELGGEGALELPISAVVITEVEVGYRLRLELGDEVREVSDPDCRTLLRTAVVIAAATREEPVAPAAEAPPKPLGASPLPRARAAPPSARKSAEPESPTISAPAGASALPTAADERTASDVPLSGFALGFGIGASAGTLPGTSAALELRAGMDPGRWLGWAVSARYWPGGDAERLGRVVHVTALGGRGVGLVRFGTALQAGLGVEVDRVAGSGREGVSGGSSDAAWRIAPTLELNLIPWRVDNLRLEFGLDTALALVRPRFVVTGCCDVYRAPRFGGAATIRALWLFR